MELVSKLEARGYHGTLYCIDGSPSTLNNFVEYALGKEEGEFETVVILKVLQYYELPLSVLADVAVSHKFITYLF